MPDQLEALLIVGLIVLGLVVIACVAGATAVALAAVKATRPVADEDRLA